MKKLMATLLLVAGSCIVTLAQNPDAAKKGGRGEKRGEKMLKEMTTTLSLTPEQQEKIKPILAETGKTMKENREKYKGNQKCMHQARFQTHKAAEAKIMAVLTPDQQTKFQAEKKKRQEERKKKREEEMMKPIECK